MSLSRAPISVFIAITPTSLALAFSSARGSSRLQRDEMEGVAQAVVEVGVLAEAVGDQHDVDQIVLDRVVEAFGEPAAVAGHAAKADLALLLGALGELPPFRVLHPPDVVDRMVEVDVEVVGPQAAQAALERRHHLGPRVARAGLGLGAQHDPVAHALQPLADRLLRPAEAIALGGVEEGHAAIERVAHQLGIVRARRAEPDLGDLEPGAAERDVALDPRGRRRAAAARPGRPAAAAAVPRPSSLRRSIMLARAPLCAASRHQDIAQGMRVSPANGIVQSPATCELPQELQHEHALDA